MESILDTPAADIGGWGAVLMSLSLQAVSSFDMANVNPYITGATAVVGFIFAIYKIAHIRDKRRVEKLNEEHQKMENEKLKRELDVLRENDKDRPVSE